MKSKMKYLLPKLISFSFCLWLLICFLFSKVFSVSFDLMNLLSHTVFISVLLFLLYVNYIWKYDVFNDTPKIYGKYIGNIIYDYKEKEGKIEVEAEIKQTFLSTHVKLITKEMTSYSKVSEIIGEMGEQILYYIYITNPKNAFNERNPIKRGACILFIEDNELRGVYWTEKKSTGDIILKKVEK